MKGVGAKFKKDMEKQNRKLMRRSGRGANLYPSRYQVQPGSNPLAEEDAVQFVEPTPEKKAELLEKWYNHKKKWAQERIYILQAVMEGVSLAQVLQRHKVGTLPSPEMAAEWNALKIEATNPAAEETRRLYAREITQRRADIKACTRALSQIEMGKGEQQVMVAYITRFHEWLRGRPVPADAEKMVKLGMQRSWQPILNDEEVAYLDSFSKVRTEYYLALTLLKMRGPGTTLKEKEIYFKYIVVGDDLTDISKNGLWHYLEYGRTDFPKDIMQSLDAMPLSPEKIGSDPTGTVRPIQQRPDRPLDIVDEEAVVLDVDEPVRSKAIGSLRQPPPSLFVRNTRDELRRARAIQDRQAELDAVIERKINDAEKFYNRAGDGPGKSVALERAIDETSDALVMSAEQVMEELGLGVTGGFSIDDEGHHANLRSRVENRLGDYSGRIASWTGESEEAVRKQILDKARRRGGTTAKAIITDLARQLEEPVSEQPQVQRRVAPKKEPKAQKKANAPAAPKAPETKPKPAPDTKSKPKTRLQAARDRRALPVLGALRQHYENKGKPIPELAYGKKPGLSKFDQAVLDDMKVREAEAKASAKEKKAQELARKKADAAASKAQTAAEREAERLARIQKKQEDKKAKQYESELKKQESAKERIRKKVEAKKLSIAKKEEKDAKRALAAADKSKPITENNVEMQDVDDEGENENVNTVDMQDADTDEAIENSRVTADDEQAARFIEDRVAAREAESNNVEGEDTATKKNKKKGKEIDDTPVAPEVKAVKKAQPKEQGTSGSEAMDVETAPDTQQAPPAAVQEPVKETDTKKISDVDAAVREVIKNNPPRSKAVVRTPAETNAAIKELVAKHEQEKREQQLENERLAAIATQATATVTAVQQQLTENRQVLNQLMDIVKQGGAQQQPPPPPPQQPTPTPPVQPIVIQTPQPPTQRERVRAVTATRTNRPSRSREAEDVSQERVRPQRSAEAEDAPQSALEERKFAKAQLATAKPEEKKGKRKFAHAELLRARAVDISKSGKKESNAARKQLRVKNKKRKDSNTATMDA
jgi:hypothetical protein